MPYITSGDHQGSNHTRLLRPPTSRPSRSGLEQRCQVLGTVVDGGVVVEGGTVVEGMVVVEDGGAIRVG